jgi:hypothetical protein
MERIIGKTFDEERAFYGMSNLVASSCKFDGPADGESAFKECSNVVAENCFFNLRYPFWHNSSLCIENSEMTELCRAALWYSNRIEISETKMRGIKALRECSEVIVRNCSIISPEFGWSTNGIEMTNCIAQSEYFMMRSSNLRFKNVKLDGKYSFQYIENGMFEDCDFQTKDAFWHAKNVTVKNSVLKGEYLGWYSDGLTLDHCTIVGTQPLCYCKNLTLVDCKMINTHLSFEKSDVQATVITRVDSIKNPRSGKIHVPFVGEIIMDDPLAKGEVVAEAPEIPEV